jgi:hypothetical protein
MSRSYHITKREAVRRFRADGDPDGVLAFLEKRYVKKAVKKLHDLNLASSSSDSKQKVIRRFAQRVTKQFMAAKKAPKSGANS